MMAVILNLAILDSAIFSQLIFPLKLTHTFQDWFPLFAQKKTSLVHSDSTWWWQPSWILPSWIQILPVLDSNILLSSLRLTQKHSSSTLTNSIWLKLIHSHLTWWWQSLELPWQLKSWSAQKKLTCSFWLNLMMAAILNSAILDSAILLKKNFTHSLWQLDDGSHLEFCHLGFRHCHFGFRHLVIFSQTQKTLFTPLTLTQTNSD